MKKPKLTTYPQMLKGEKGQGWTVVSGGIRGIITQSDLEGKLLVVPDGEGVVERNLRAWEMAGARWSPFQSIGKLAERNDVTPGALRAAEDYRLGFNLQRMSPSLFATQLSKGRVEPEAIEGYIEALRVDDPQMMEEFPLVMAELARTEGLARLYGGLKAKQLEVEKVSGEEAKILASGISGVVTQMRQLEKAAEELMGKQLRRSFPAFARSVELAKILMNFQETMTQQAKGLREQMVAARTNKACSKEMKDLKDEKGRSDKHKVRESPIIQAFGKMSIRVPPLVMPLKAKNKIARHRVTEEGILPFQLYRLHVDGRIFLDPRKQRGGTVLVDISGSMGLTPEQVYEFVLKCPGATIAQYSGTGRRGELVVVAHKGRIAPKGTIGDGFGGNIVDGPALEWLGRQASPRVWVSDTQVTGVGDTGSHKLREICLAHAARYQIKIVTEFDPLVVARALHTSSRKLLAKIKKENPYG